MVVLTKENVRTFAGLQIIDNMEEQPGLCLAIYGTGGKTTVLADIVSSPLGTPALLLDIDGSSSSVRHLIAKGLEIVRVKSWKEADRIRLELKKGNHPYKAVITDNVSELAAMALEDVRPGPAKQIQDYAISTARILTWCRDFRDMADTDGIHSLFTLWEETEKDDLTGLIRNKLSLTPKLSASLPGIIRMIGRLTVPGTVPPYVRQLSFAPSVKTDTKWRVDPTDSAAKIPQVLYLNDKVHFLADFLETVVNNKSFPVSQYAAPPKVTGGSTT